MALVRYAAERITEFSGSEDPDDVAECREIVELVKRNLAVIEGQARAAAKWFEAGGR